MLKIYYVINVIVKYDSLIILYDSDLTFLKNKIFDSIKLFFLLFFLSSSRECQICILTRKSMSFIFHIYDLATLLPCISSGA